MASVSRVIRVASSWLPLLAAGLLGCSDGSSNPPDPGSAPLIADLQLWPGSVVLNGGGGADTVQFGFAFTDPDADVAGVVVTVLDGAGAQVSQVAEPVTNPTGQTWGNMVGLAVIPTTTLATYTVEVRAFDSRDNRSNVLRDRVTVTEGNPVPTIAALSPASVPAGSPALTLTVTGTGFLQTSTVTWAGYDLLTTYVNGTTLQAQVESYRLSYAGTAAIVVTNPPPLGGSSAPMTFTIEPPAPAPVPTLASISPVSVDAGGPSFTLTVTGSGFVPSSRLLWNGSWYFFTTWVDANTLTATVSPSLIATPGTATISVTTPAPGGGTSSSLTFTVARPQQPGVTLVGLKANDVSWDPYQRRIYVSVPSVSPVNPNTVTAVDPVSGQVTGSTWVGSEPDRIAISDDGQFLYVALRGASSVERLTLPDLAPELGIGLGRDPLYGAYYASDLRVAPGSPRALAVSLATSGSTSASGGLAVFDDGTPRPTRAATTAAWWPYGSLQWGATAAELYAAVPGYGSALYVLAVDASGVVLQDSYLNAFSTYGGEFRFDAGTGLVYADEGRVIDPATGLLAGTYSVTSLYSRHVVPDASLGSAFFVSGDTYGAVHATLSVYDLTHFTMASSSMITFVGGPPRRPIRWGVDGLAFLTPEQVVLVRGPAVLPPSTTQNPVPTVASLTPSAANAGSPNLVVRVSGTGFVRGSTALWNGSERATTFVSATELVAYVPASDLAAAGSAEITVASPAPGGGTSGAATFTVGQ